jgi:formamidopyrimidine-DNA glycosylase
MPELPEVETTVRGLARVLQGREIRRVELRREDLRRAFPTDLGQRLTGARITRLHRRAKYGLIDTDRGDTLIFHLGMSGSWRIDKPVGLHDHLLMETDKRRRLALNDPRRFGSVDLVATDALDEWPQIAALGPEPTELEATQLRQALAGRAAPIKQLLLDQAVVAGLGNIYVCEALHRAGINPKRAGGSISSTRLQGHRAAQHPRRALHILLFCLSALTSTPRRAYGLKEGMAAFTEKRKAKFEPG